MMCFLFAVALLLFKKPNTRDATVSLSRYYYLALLNRVTYGQELQRKDCNRIKRKDTIAFGVNNNLYFSVRKVKVKINK